MSKLSATETAKALNTFGERVVRLSKINLGVMKKDNTGALRKSLSYDLNVFRSGNFSFSFDMEEYAGNVDRGRKAGKGIPVNVLDKWIKTKPVRLRDLETGKFLKQTPSRMKSLSYLINRKIKNKGIEPTHFFSEPFEEEFKKLPDILVKSFALDVESYLEQQLKII